MNPWSWVIVALVVLAVWFVFSIPLGMLVGRWIRGASPPPQAPAPGEAPPAANDREPPAVPPESPAPGHNQRRLTAVITIHDHQRRPTATVETYDCPCYVVRDRHGRVIRRHWCDEHGHFARWEKEMAQ